MIKPTQVSDKEDIAHIDRVFFNLFHDRLDPQWLALPEAETALAFFHAGWKACKEENE